MPAWLASVISTNTKFHGGGVITRQQWELAVTHESSSLRLGRGATRLSRFLLLSEADHANPINSHAWCVVAINAGMAGVVAPRTIGNSLFACRRQGCHVCTQSEPPAQRQGPLAHWLLLHGLHTLHGLHSTHIYLNTLH